jgi:LysM repeat protein
MRRIFIGIGLIIIAAAIFMFWSRNRAEPGTSGESNELVAAAAVEVVTQVPTAALPEATPTAVAPTTAGPTAAPTETRSPASPTPVPTPTNLVYTVEEFDTLLGIAIEFETTVEALVAANGIGENEFLQIGQELVILTGEGTADTTQVEPADQPEPAAASVNSQGEELPAVPAVSQAEPSAETVALSENTPATVVTQNSSPVSDTPKSDTFEVEDSAAGTSPEAAADSSGESVSEVAVGDTAVPIFAAPPPINTTRPANIRPVSTAPMLFMRRSPSGG